MTTSNRKLEIEKSRTNTKNKKDAIQKEARFALYL